MGVLHVWGDGAPLGGEGANGGSIFMCAYEKSDELSFATNFRPLGGIGEK
jgi:GTPase involved in cell partitioning and DNA repair